MIQAILNKNIDGYRYVNIYRYIFVSALSQYVEVQASNRTSLSLYIEVQQDISFKLTAVPLADKDTLGSTINLIKLDFHT